MRPAHERNQECLPPKKRDLPLSSSVGGDGGGGEDASSAHSSDSTGRDSLAGGSAPGEWMRAQQGAHYALESSDSLGVPLDQYGMLYKLALPSASYPPSSLHPVLSHISPAYTVPSSLLQHPGIPYPPLGYTPIPHSSLQFVSPPYALPYAVPPGFVPGPLIPPQSAVPSAHHIPHLVPYPSVIQGGVVSPPPQTPGPAPAVLPQDRAAVRRHLAATELNSRGTPSFYHYPGTRADYRDSQQEREKEVNGGEEEQRGGKESSQDPAFPVRGPQALLSAPPGSVEADRPQDRAGSRFEARGSPAHRNTPDTDLEVQQVVARLASPNQVLTGSRKEAPLGPLNLSQGAQREREVLLGARGEDVLALGRTAYVAPLCGPDDPRLSSHHQQPAHHAVLLANGQPVLVPLDYQQQHHPAPPCDVTTTSSAAASPKTSEPQAALYPPERPGQSPAAGVVQPAVAPPHSPSHFTKGAIIQLATGELKRVEDLQTQDFVRSAEVSGGLKIDSSMVVDIRKSQRPGLVALFFSVGEQQSKVAIDVPPEHPFFVFGQGWSSCSPDRTAQLYGLDCQHLQAGDVCVSIALQQHKPQQQPQSRAPAKASSAPTVAFEPMGPPAPQHPRPSAHVRGERTHRDREEEQSVQGGGAVHREAPPRPERTPSEHARGRSGYHLHSEGPQWPGAGASSLVPTAAAHRRWSAPGFQKYEIKSEEATHPCPAAVSSRPSFIPQEIKLSIEGRSNAGK